MLPKYITGIIVSKFYCVLLSISQLFGHLHPALVHLPIGILLIGLLLQWQAHKRPALQQAVPTVLLAGAITALLSCITGYLLSISDDYDKAAVTWHMWMGFATALVSLMLYAKEKNPQFAINKKLLAFGLLVLVFVTGHLGGNLTHGSDYFTKPLEEMFGGDSISSQTIKPIPNVQEAQVYADVVQPILQTKCYSCHGPNKQKGGLRMDDSTRLIKGGKDGIIIKPGKGDESELVKRLLLPSNDDDHMPPKEKPQLSKEQIALLHWWVDNNAAFTKKVKELSQPDAIKPALLALQKGDAPVKVPTAELPAQPVEAADSKVLEQLKQNSVVAIPLAQGTNYLQVSFVTDSVVTPTVLQLLAKLKKQVLVLKINNTNIGDDALLQIAQLISLTRLDVSHTHITDKGLQSLLPLQSLGYLNLVGTGVTEAGLLKLKALPKLKSLYIYQTNVSKAAYAQLKSSFPKTGIDTGGYNVPTLSTDTTLVKAKQQY